MDQYFQERRTAMDSVPMLPPPVPKVIVDDTHRYIHHPRRPTGLLLCEPVSEAAMAKAVAKMEENAKAAAEAKAKVKQASTSTVDPYMRRLQRQARESLKSRALQDRYPNHTYKLAPTVPAAPTHHQTTMTINPDPDVRPPQPRSASIPSPDPDSSTYASPFPNTQTTPTAPTAPTSNNQPDHRPQQTPHTLTPSPLGISYPWPYAPAPHTLPSTTTTHAPANTHAAYRPTPADDSVAQSSRPPASQPGAPHPAPPPPSTSSDKAPPCNLCGWDKAYWHPAWCPNARCRVCSEILRKDAAWNGAEWCVNCGWTWKEG